MTRQDRRFLSCIAVADLERLKAERQLAKKHYVLRTANGRIADTKERFFEAVNLSLPLDPFYPPGIAHSWDALDDSLFGGLLGLEAPEADIIWPFANDVGIAFLVTGVKFFKNVADSVRNRDFGPQDNDSIFVSSF